jgi:streptogramin lyase
MAKPNKFVLSLLTATVLTLFFIATMNGSLKHSLLIAPAFAFPADQKTVVQSTWALPVFTQDIQNMVSDFAGNAYFSETSSNKIGRLEPSTNTVTEWGISSSGNSSARPTGIAFDPSTGTIYFTESGTNKIGRYEPTTDRITKWDVGGDPSAITVTSAGSVFYIDDIGRMGRLG